MPTPYAGDTILAGSSDHGKAGPGHPGRCVGVSSAPDVTIALDRVIALASLNRASDPPRTADIVIVGGGVIGAATAFAAARAGLRPVVLEARPDICTLTTPVAAGAFRLQFDDRDELELVRESVETFLHFEDVTEQDTYGLDLRQQGYLWLTTDDRTAVAQRALVDKLHAWGQTDVELLDGDGTRERFPWVDDRVIQSRFRAADGFLDTKRLTFGLALGAKATVVTSCMVEGFRTQAGKLTAVQTSRGDVATDLAVVAAGPLSGLVAASAAIDLPVVAIRRQKLILPDVPEVPADAPMTIDEDTGAHWRPAHAGAWVLFTDPSTPPSEPAMDVPLDHRFAFELLDPASPVSVARVVPFWRDVWARGSDHWLLQAGQYTVTPDHRPLIGRTPIEGLFVNAGHDGHGVMLSVATGRLVMDEITGASAGVPNPFRPDRPMRRSPQPTL
jgi:glycine/D-amino acid oxidase-like deaminating enzyme